jgi:hypothetical protein
LTCKDVEHIRTTTRQKKAKEEINPILLEKELMMITGKNNIEIGSLQIDRQ